MTEIGLVAHGDGGYELALYRRADNQLIRFGIDPALAWAISGTLKAPIVAEPLNTAAP